MERVKQNRGSKLYNSKQHYDHQLHIQNYYTKQNLHSYDSK